QEYAVLRHGGNEKFVNSLHGKQILLEAASKIRTQEVSDLTANLARADALCEELSAALNAERREKLELRNKVGQLEAEVTALEEEFRRRDTSAALVRGRGSNLERRLAGNSSLRSYLFGGTAE
ncbi:unnamed protein product, partial [Phaeothamnion confervicola]